MIYINVSKLAVLSFADGKYQLDMSVAAAEAFLAQEKDADGNWTGFWKRNSDYVTMRDSNMLEVSI